MAASAVEGNPVTFTVSQDVMSDHATTVKVAIYSTPSDTATEGADYQLIDTIDVVIDANTLTKTFDVATYVDQLQEGSETFTAHIVSATNDNGAVDIGTADATGTILDDYNPPEVSIGTGISGGSAVEGNPVTFTVSQDVMSDHATTVKVAIYSAEQ